MPAKINIGDVWKDVSAMKVNIGDSWKTVSGGWINIGDSWKKFYGSNRYSVNANTLRYYKFNGNGTDGAGNSNLTLSNATVTSPGYESSGLTINTTAGYASMASINHGSAAFTYCFWVKFSSVTGHMGFCDSGYASGGILIKQYNGVNFSVWASNLNQMNYDTTFSTGTWYNIIYTRDSGVNAKFYLNGVLKSTSARNDNISAPQTMYIGNYRNSSNRVAGVMDEFIVENRVWDQTMVTAYYNDNVI